jgi:hypothetical protein
MARVARDDDRARGKERGHAPDHRAGERARDDRAPDRERVPAPISAPAAAKAGLRQIVELTGKEPEGVTAVRPAEDGWMVGVEVVEDRRIPSSSDVLAIYEAELDADGVLTSYRRSRRYSRGRGGSDEA